MTAPDLSDIEPMPQPDVRGILAINNLPNSIQQLEDATAMADMDRYRYRNPRGHEREATDTERMLLQYLGFELPDQLTTKVSWPSRSIRRREWPQLEQETAP